MVTYYVKQGEVYKVSATVTCDVHDGNGTLMLTCPASSIITFKAPTTKVSLSDDNAVISCISEVSGDLSGLTEHVNNSSVHTTYSDKLMWNDAVNELSEVKNHVDNDTVHITAAEKIALGGIVGEIKNYSGKSVPDGYLLCDGSAVSRTQYAALFSAIGIAWGDGDGSTTFNLPNLIDRVIWGAATAGGYIDAGLPNIEGSFSIVDGYTTPANLIIGDVSGAFSKETGNATSNFGTFDYSSNGPNKLTKATLDASKSNEIYGNSSTVQPPAAKLIPIIKY